MLSLRKHPPLCLLFLLVMPALLQKPSDSEWDIWRKRCWYQRKSVSLARVELVVLPGSQDSEGGVKEGTDVSLRCSLIRCRFLEEMADRFLWFQNGLRLPYTTSQIQLASVSGQDSGTYTCGVTGYVETSLPVTLNVRCAPMQASVSIRPSSEVAEGSSVTLFCNSTSKGTVKYTWYKGSTAVAQGAHYHISNVGAEDGGEYVCHASGEHREAYANETLTISRSPKVVSVSVTMTCDAEANPPVQDYLWFKEGHTSPVAFGRSFRIANILEEDISQYYCEAQNSIGHHSARLAWSVMHKEECPTALAVAAGIGGCCGALGVAVLFAGLWMRKRKKKTTSSEKERKKNVGTDATDDSYARLDPQSRASSDVYTSLNTVYSRSQGTTRV
ncbi:B-cell receptor CD22-like isoform X2 [Electrophorus electricus]|uniref:B-cell receptor CD22-like isoform X2 n=1 Tax=Electrophorus electricus TaxID=8005 RepID=UPI0015D03582|nr:B-cell receptor CD22-like isoform X2 [Electrophorus electricus]XP_026871297.2 B-cell receptor CD22-like isoform X2 [Electrophorus electricus]